MIGAFSNHRSAKGKAIAIAWFGVSQYWGF